MIKQTLTNERKERVFKSVQFMAVMAEMIKIEYMQDMDVRFKNPQANQFAGRIIKDAQAIQTHLATNDNVNIKFVDMDFTAEYAAELYRVLYFFCGLPIEQIRTVMDNILSESEKINDL